MRRRVWMETYGCQMNKAESEALLIELSRAGWLPGESEADSDLVILNTCSVRETAEERIRGRLGHFRHAKKRRSFTLVVTGCMAERLKEGIVRDFPEVDVVLGTFRKSELLEAVRKAEASRSPVVTADGDRYEFSAVHSTGGIKAFVPIMHGCDNFCAYCVVPYVRGREVSRPPEEILAEIRTLDGRGIREVTLLGQNVNSYRHGGSGNVVGFPALLRSVAREAGGIHWVRYLTSHPRDFSVEILDAMSESPVFCRHVHLPLQSGSSRVLRLMNRGYSAERYEEIARLIRGALNGVSITTDILIGFPGETEEDVAETLDMMDRVGFDDAFTYYYNPREGTPAFSMKDALPEETKLERLSRVIERQRAISGERARQRLGSRIEVLVESVSKKSGGELLARTDWDAMVVFPGDASLIGGFARVRLDSMSGNTFKASLA